MTGGAEAKKSSGARRSAPEWLWLGRAVAEAEAELGARGPAERHALGRARAAAELADRALEPSEPLKAGSGKWLALVLYREAFAWALRAEGARGGSLRELWEATPAATLEFAAGGESALESLRALALGEAEDLLESDSVEAADAGARTLKSAVQALLYRRAAPERRLAVLLAQRWLRVAALFAVAIVAAVSAATLIERLALGPDLAAGARWRTSSVAFDCEPEKQRCGGAKTRIFFHTRHEPDPWFELDLGKTKTLSVVEVDNRDACCPDRALPLIVELSRDGKRWQEVERRTETFYRWRAAFEPQPARYVRLRVPRQTTLHLVRVSVYAG